MKKIYILAVILLSPLFLFSKETSRFDRSSIIKIEIGQEGKKVSESKIYKHDLERRIYRLEKAVRQLQEKVFDLEFENTSLKEDKKKYTCYIKTPFDGVFTSTKLSMTEAKADVLKACSEKTQSSIRCGETDVKCDNQ